MGSCRSGGNQIVYDGDGNGVSKTVLTNGVPASTYYLVDDLNPTGYPQVVEELQGTIVTRQYTYGLQRIDENQLISNTWTPSFYGYDGGGNDRQLTNSAGTVTDSYEYDAFGNSFTVSGSTPNNYLYRGEQYDPDLDLYYLRARYYDPLTGRFMSRDPEEGDFTNPASLHKYLYAGGDPANHIDPSGRFLLEVPAWWDWATGEANKRILKPSPASNGSILRYVEQIIKCGSSLLDDAGDTLNRVFRGDPNAHPYVPWDTFRACISTILNTIPPPLPAPLPSPMPQP